MSSESQQSVCPPTWPVRPEAADNDGPPSDRPSATSDARTAPKTGLPVDLPAGPNDDGPLPGDDDASLWFG